jgi:hypothetical protein
MRKLSDGSIFVQYQVGGKALDASFRNMEEFVNWLKTNI